MSDGLEHREYADALGAYALGALPEDEAERVRRHLEGCPKCRAELDGLRVAVDALPASVEQVEPPPELKAAADGDRRSPRRSCCGPRRGGGPSRGGTPAPAGGGSGRRALVAPRRLRSHSSARSRSWWSWLSVRRRRHTHDPCPGEPVAAGRGSPRVGAGHREPRSARRQRLPLPAADHVDELWVQHGAAASAAGRDVRRPLGLGRGRAPGPSGRPRAGHGRARAGDLGADDSPLLVARV